MKMAQKKSYTISNEVLSVARKYLAHEKQDVEYFGNGRAVRNLFELMKKNLAKRVIELLGSAPPAGLDKEDISTFSTVDIPQSNSQTTVFLGNETKFDQSEFTLNQASELDKDLVIKAITHLERSKVSNESR